MRVHLFRYERSRPCCEKEGEREGGAKEVTEDATSFRKAMASFTFNLPTAREEKSFS